LNELHAFFLVDAIQRSSGAQLLLRLRLGCRGRCCRHRGWLWLRLLRRARLRRALQQKLMGVKVLRPGRLLRRCRRSRRCSFRLALLALLQQIWDVQPTQVQRGGAASEDGQRICIRSVGRLLLHLNQLRCRRLGRRLGRRGGFLGGYLLRQGRHLIRQPGDLVWKGQQASHILWQGAALRQDMQALLQSGGCTRAGGEKRASRGIHHRHQEA
jgi:hypothetical protein